MLTLCNLWEVVVTVTLLTAGCRRADSLCTERRCLAEKLVKQEFLTQPQSDNCTQKIFVPFIEYETLSVDTKNLILNSRLIAQIRWIDPDLSWDTSVYPFTELVLPVNKVWTPVIKVTNGISTTMLHGSSDLLVYSNGTIEHIVIITAKIDCEVNLFNYPFAGDECPVAIQAWATDTCGMTLVLGQVRLVDGSHGDWETIEVGLQKKRHDRNYIMVRLSTKYKNPFITLLLPTILIIVADVVSFSLPFGGGERNSFKVTLVLSFTMFLIILNDLLPGDSQCSPIIRGHFCVCLILLVLNMLLSMILTRFARDGSFIFSCGWKKSPEISSGKTNQADEEPKLDITVIQPGAKDEESLLRKVVLFLEALNVKELENDRHLELANKVDKIVFWVYIVIIVVYFTTMFSIMLAYTCEIDHFSFWYD
ncbi:5-hydroxytryptamine receptor 3A-like [Genypterus blacodes]|uniref:5-hydroxytryptamine receptor 3A-like n=1 Tax=Genypterus blacodes TaxID=154954 RepID=UPI003F758484